jgi:ABC-type branched-subunit amino acid transport system permease subunit/ABC-type branched-subunit amino acid transport system ATPase component
LLLAFPWVAPSSYWLRVACWVGLYAMLASGLNIVVGLAGLLDLGYVAFYGLGSYTYALLASEQFEIHWPFLAIVVTAGAVTALAGILLGLPVLRLRGDYLAIVTLGFGEMTYILLINLDRPINITNGTNGIIGIDVPRMLGFSFDADWKYYYLILGLLALSLLVIERLKRARLGRAWIALREDELAAAANGINTTTTKLWAFALGATFAGIAGAVAAALQGSVFPDSFLFTESILILAMVVLGGMGHLLGAVVGAAVLVILPELLRPLSDYRLLIFGLLLMVIMIFRPEGFVVSRQRRRELRPDDDLIPPDSADGRAPAMATGTATADRARLLELVGVEAGYGGIRALRGISLEVRPGEIVTLIGSNGAGKTTTLKVIAGLIRARAGEVRLAGEQVNNLAPNRRVALGISMAPEGRGIFQQMTVRENLLMGAYQRRDRAELASDLERVFKLLPRLQERQAQAGGTLSGGEQQMLAIGRALMARPKLLLLDEPSLGLAPLLVDAIFEIIRTINEQGTTILLVEQNALRALEIANRGYVLQNGRIVLADTAERLLETSLVREAYLGAGSP